MVADNVVVTLLGVELDRKATDVAHGVGATLFTASGAETEENGRLLANAVHELGAGRHCHRSKRDERIWLFRNGELEFDGHE